MQVRILGPLEIWADGHELPVGAGRQRALLLALLLHADKVVSSERLIDELWGERPPQTAGKVVQGYVSQLRKALPADVLVTRANGYLLRIEETDASEFERLVEQARTQEPQEAVRTLRRALELWRGRPLADVEYEDWAQGEIARLEELRLTALEDRIEAELRLGRAAALVSELEALVREHPLRERLRAQLMLALYRSGRQAHALDVYADARRRLVEELGLEPSAELNKLQRRILAQDPALGGVQRPLLERAAGRSRLLILAGTLLLVGAGVAAALLLTRSSAPLVVRPNEVVEIDPATNRAVAAASVGDAPSRVVAGGGAVWVVNADDRTVSKLDPNTMDVRTFSTGAKLSDLAVGGGALWTANGDARSVTKVDLQSTDVIRTIRLSRSPNADAAFVAADAKSAWVSGGGPREEAAAWRIDPRRSRVVRQIDVHEGAGLALWAALGDGSVWIRGDQGLLRADARTGTVQAQIDLPWNAFATEDTGGLAVAANGVWVTSVASESVWHVDPGTNLIAGSLSVGGVPSGVAVGAGSVWVTDQTNGRLLRIDPATHRVVKTIRLGQNPNGIAFAYNRVWVSVD